MKFSYRRVGRAFRGPRFGLVLLGGAAAGLGSIAVQLTFPWVVARIIDGALVKSDPDFLRQAAATLVGLALASVIFLIGHKLAFLWLAEQTLVRLCQAISAHIQRLPLSFLDRQPSGTLRALLTDEAPTATRLYVPVASDGMVAIVQLVATLTVVGHQYGAVVLVAFVILPVYVFLPLILGPRMRRASDRLLEAKAELGSRVQEVIEAVKLIKVFGREQWAQHRVGKAFDYVFKRQLGVGRVQSTYTLNYAAYWMMVSFLYWFGGRQVLAGQLTVGELIALVWYLGLLDGPTRQLVSTHAQAQSALGAAERLEAFLARPAEAVDSDSDSKKDLAPRRHRVEFKEVSFRYSSEARNALDGVSFSVEPGMRVGIVGPSGAGKSTLTSLLSGLYEPQQGAICIGGEDIREYRLASLRQQVGIVLQETYLFSGSVSENILFGRLDAEERQIQAASRAANAHRFIMDLPGGYDSEVGERGGKLSVGQKQRIAIARVVVRDPGILILDEATSALDSESERLVEDALERLAKGRTTFMITHHLRRVTQADLVLVLDNGRLVASGRHPALLETSSVYARLWRSGERDTAARPAADAAVLSDSDSKPVAAQPLVAAV